MKHLKSLLTILLLFIGVGTYAALPESGYYRIKSHNSKYLTENVSSNTLICADEIAGSYSQVWYLNVSGSNVTIKNVLSDKYIQGQGTFSKQYSTGNSSQNFTIAEESSVFTFEYDGTYHGGLHCDNSNVVVEWYISDSKSKWTVEAATVDAAELTSQRNAFWEGSLSAFFTTTACTELNDTYKSYSDNALRSAMAAMPTTVQDMAVKVKNNSWTTYAGWDKTEKTFRIADYKAYSSSSRWTNILGLGHTFGRLTNPTGISVSAGEYLQVYVGAIPSGQAVKLEVAGQYQATGTIYALHQGINALLMVSSGNCFVYYEVDNTTSGSAPYTAIASYAPVTIHIEGGTVNGYFDLTKNDDNDDWAKLQANLLSGSSVDIKTSNLLFHMNTDLVKDACPTKMVEMLGEWDKILDMEYNLMGLEDFDGYWNNLLSVTDMSGEDYMHASDYGTFYDVGTIDEVMSYDDLFAGGALWGPAHENGHIFQKYINMVGCTEVSNNLFSNAVIFNNGHLTSRATNISVTFENMANNVFWNDRDIWERTHLYFQLYQFFHILGKDSDFFPELFKALRSDPMVHTGNTFISATDDYLKFYKKCCSVSGYDLTEFFQAYGFFVIPTLTSYTLSEVTKDAFKIGDYGNYYLTVTQAEIDAAKQAVADMGLPKANIIFIEDRITAPAATYEGAPSGAKKTAFTEEYPIGLVGETGQYTTFGVTPSAYTYNVNTRGYVTMSGTGAVGFKLYDNSGNLIGLYNTNTFKLPAGAYDAEGLVTGYTIKAAAGNGSDSAASRDNSIEVQVDVVDVNAVAENASETLIVGSPVTTEGGITSGKPYLLKTGASRYIMDWGSFYNVDSENKISTEATELSAIPTKASTYSFISNGDGTWKIKNYFTGKYWGIPVYNAALAPAEEAAAGAWSLNFSSNIAYPSAPDAGSTVRGIDRSNGKVCGWNTGTNNNHKVYIYEISASSTPLDEINDKLMSVANEPAATLQTGQWYVMFDRGAYHGYLYENSSSHTLYNTSTAPSGDYAPLNAQYLVRIVGENDHYYLQTGFGNYFGEFISNTAVKTTALREHPIILKKILRNDGHYYLTSEAGVVLDANACNAGDATVVGYGTTIPSTTGGNNDWAFYPVTLTDNYKYGFLSSDVEVFQGHQTTGKGNTAQALLRVKVTPFKACRATNINVTLSSIDQLDHVAVYTTTSDQLRASGASPVKISTDITPAASLNIPVTMSDMTAGETIYFWITGDIKSSATEWATVDASITSITYTNDYIEANTLERTVCNIADKGNPDGTMRIYKSQKTLWTSTQSGTQYYRIPALLKTGTNTLLAFTDDRYASTKDLGVRGSGSASRIDVLVKKSTDGGLTWGDAVTVAAGDGSSDAGCGYGDAAVAQAANGDIVCLMAAGNKSYSSGMLHIGYTKSTDGGATWSSPVDIYGSANLTNNHTFQSTFVSSGHGITQTIANAGRIAFPALGKVSGTTNEYVIYSDDNGDTWTFTDNYGYTVADESKLLELNDGKLLMSIRTGQFNSSANRGYNRTTDTNVENWGSQGTWSDLNANGCNSDLIYYSRNPNGTNDVMLHSVVKSYSDGHRKDLRLYMSFDQGATWTEAFQLQPGWAAYSSMQVLDNGDLAILFEDGSIGNEDVNDCYDINYVTISHELMDAKIIELNPLAASSDVKVIYGTTAHTIYGTLNGLTWTSKVTSGVATGDNTIAGLTMVASDGAFDKFSDWNSHYNIAYHPATSNTDATLTLTAPKGYVIASYSMLVAKGSSASHTYTVTNEAGTSTDVPFGSNASSYATVSQSNINKTSTVITIRTSNVGYWLAIADFTVSLKRAANYHVVDASGNEMASQYVAFESDNIANEMPTTLKRAFCSYSYFSDAACTVPATTFGNKSDVYVLCTVSAPFEFSTEVNPKWYLIYSHEQQVDGDYYSYADGSTYNSAIAATNDICANPAYCWAFIGNPYNVQLLNKKQEAYLAAAALTGTNGTVVSSAVTTNTVSYPYNSFSLYGYTSDKVTTSNPFSLILNGSSYIWVNGADKDYSSRTGELLYHSGITFNGSQQLNNWRGANLMVREASDVVTISAACTDGEGNYYGTYSKGTAFVVPSDLTVSEIQVVDGKLKLTNYATDAIVPANTGVLVSSTTPGNHTIILAAGGTSVLGSDNLLKPSGDAGINAEGMAVASASGTKFYRLTMHSGTELGFWWGAAEGGAFNLAANKAYLAVPSGTLVKGFSLSADDLTDGISQIEDGKLNIENAIYDLSGRRISVSSVSSERSVLPKGVYIVNGKKYIKK